METFIEAKELVKNPNFSRQRQIALSEIVFDIIDEPIVNVIKKISKISCCFTLQSCYGHFLYSDQTDRKNIEPISFNARDKDIEYRIAYIALCVENSPNGRNLLKDISNLPSIDPKNIQCGSAEWFWTRQINSYVVQVEPERFRTKDRCTIDYQEAIHIENIRNLFFNELDRLIDKHT